MLKYWLQLPMFWRFQLSAWLAFIVLTFPLKLELSMSLGQTLDLVLVRDGSSFLLTLGLRLLYRRFWSENGFRLGVLLFTACIAAGLLQNALFYLLRSFVPLTSEIFRVQPINFDVFYERTGLLFGWSFLYFGIRAWLNEKAKESALKEEREMREQVELQMLRSLTNSHFLCNALNIVQAALDHGNAGACGMVQTISDYLNYSLKHRSENVVPLREEVKALENYLYLQHASLGATLDFGLQVMKGLDSIKVPGFVLQPLVENAIKYGRETHQRKLSVRIVVQRDGDYLLVEVFNTGRWIPPDPFRRSGGVGIETIRRKLEWLYPNNHNFTTLEEEGWVTVSIRFPIDL